MVNLIGDQIDPFITVDDLRIAVDDPDLDDNQAQWLCDYGSAAVRADVGQTVNIIANDETVLDGSGATVVLLPELQVLAVHTVTLHGRELEADVDYAWDSAGCLWRLRHAHLARWPAWPRCLQVTYDHGWAPPSAQWNAARQVALEVAARMFHNPEMLQSEQLGSYSRTWMTTGGRTNLTDTEKRSLDCLRRGV